MTRLRTHSFFFLTLPLHDRRISAKTFPGARERSGHSSTKHGAMGLYKPSQAELELREPKAFDTHAVPVGVAVSTVVPKVKEHICSHW